MPVKRSLFAFFDNPCHDADRALHEQMALICEAEAAGLDEVWVSEHHFNDFSLSGPILPLMGAICGMTRRIAVGSAGVLLPYHNPLMVAESFAVLERLYPGRLRFGMAKGSFPLDDRHFRSSPERNRNALFEAAHLTRRLLAGERVSHSGVYYDLEEAVLVPSAPRPIPSYLATFGSEESVRFAAQEGLGVMMGQTATLDEVDTVVRCYRDVAGRDPELVLLRLCCIDDDTKTAKAGAQRAAALFSERMRRVKAGSAAYDTRGFAPTRDALFASHPMAERSLSGTPEACRAQLKAYREAGVTSVAIRPGGATAEENLAIVRAFSAL